MPMVVPQWARYLVAFAGLLVVIGTATSVIGTVITPRPATGRLPREIDRVVDAAYRGATRWAISYMTRDRVLASQAATLVICQLITWLLLFFVGYSLLLWPLFHGGIIGAFSTAGSAFWNVGGATAHGAPERAVKDAAALTSLITVALQISYLPALYSAFNRRATEVALLNARAGLPAWGPELPARTHYGLGSGRSTIDTLPQLYATWERWAADVMESHTTYPPLVRVRSPVPLSSWVTALLAVLDSAALILTLAPSQAPTVPARMCLRSGFLCVREIATTMGLSSSNESTASGVSLTYEEFLDGVTHMRAAGFPVERLPQEAWPDFVGWRVNYEQAAYAIANAIDAVPALWSGPRRFGAESIPPIRPPL
jgi:hypothetical protein